MTPRDRARVLAVPLVTVATAGADAAHLIATASRDDLAALVLLLARSADTDLLRTVVKAPDDSMERLRRDTQLRVAHARADKCRRAGLAVPEHVRVLENEYWRLRQQARKVARRMNDGTPGTVPGITSSGRTGGNEAE